jgi:hypothetical protein
MNTSNTLLLCLVLHLTGLILMAGMAIADLMAFGNFWKQYKLDKPSGLAVLQAASGYQRVLAIGAALLLITGISMMALTHGIFGEQLWMKIKIGIVVLILINGPIVGRIQGSKLKELLMDNTVGAAVTTQIEILRKRVLVISLANLLFLAAIVTLSVFKFN